MYDGQMLRYGRINESAAGAGIVPVPMEASQVVTAASGRFIFMNSSSQAELCDDDSESIFGWLQTHAHTPTDGDTLACEIDLTAIYRVPIITGTFVNGMIGDLVDLDIDSNIQGVDLTASSYDLLIIVAGDTTNSKWVDVMMNPEKWGTATGAEA